MRGIWRKWSCWKIPEVPWQLQKVTCELALVCEALTDLENILNPWICGIPAGLGLSGESGTAEGFPGKAAALFQAGL